MSDGGFFFSALVLKVCVLGTTGGGVRIGTVGHATLFLFLRGTEAAEEDTACGGRLSDASFAFGIFVLVALVGFGGTTGGGGVRVGFIGHARFLRGSVAEADLACGLGGELLKIFKGLSCGAFLPF